MEAIFKWMNLQFDFDLILGSRDQIFVQVEGLKTRIEKHSFVHFIELEKLKADENIYDLSIQTDSIDLLWALIQVDLNLKTMAQSPLTVGTIIVCQGELGWDDYFLLHHYDSEIKTDTLGRIGHA